MASESKELSVRIGHRDTRIYKVNIDGVDKSTIFGFEDIRLIPLKNFKNMYMEVPIMPLECLCGCKNNRTFSEIEQNEKYDNGKFKGKYRCFVTRDHAKWFKKKHVLFNDNANEDVADA
jgi:hypothetical protein